MVDVLKSFVEKPVSSSRTAKELVDDLGIKTTNKETIGREGKGECKTVKKALESELLKKGLAMSYFDDLHSEKERRNSNEYNSFIEDLGKLDTLSDERLKDILLMIQSVYDNRSNFSKKLLNRVFKKGGNDGKLFVDSILRNEKGDLDAEKLLKSIINYIDVEISEIKKDREKELRTKKIKEIQDYQKQNEDKLLKNYSNLSESNKFKGLQIDKFFGLKSKEKDEEITFDSTDEVVAFALYLVVEYILRQYKKDNSAKVVELKVPNSYLSDRRKNTYGELKSSVDQLTENTKGFNFDEALLFELEKYGIILNKFNSEKLKCDISNSLIIPKLASK